MAEARWLLAVLLALVLAAPARPQPADPERARRLGREALALYGLSILQQRQDHLVEAVKTLEEVVRLDPEAVPPRLALVPLYSAVGRPDDAARAAAAVLTLDSSQAATWRTLAKLLHEMRRTPEAMGVLRRCVAAPQMADHPADLMAAHRDLGRLYTALGAHDRAAGSYRQALGLLAEHRAAFRAKGIEEADLNRERADLSEGLGAAALAAGQFADARAAVEQARASYRLVDDTARADRLTTALAAAHAGLGEATRATALLDPYLRTKPHDLDAFALKARLLRDAGAGGSVPEILRSYVRADPDYLELRVLLGDECRRPGDQAGAESAYAGVIARRADVAAYRGLFAVLAGPGGSPARLFALVDETLGRTNVNDDGKPRNPSAAEHMRAMSLALQKEPAAAGLLLTTGVRELQRWRAFGVRDPAAAQERARRMYQTWRLLGGVAERAGQLATAEDLFRESLRSVRRASSEQEGAVYQALLRVLQAQRKWAEVVAVCGAGLARPETTSRLLLFFDLARAELKLGRIEAALQHADEAVKVATDASRLDTRLLRVYVLTFAERFDDAEADCLKLLQEFPAPGDVTRIRRELANVYSTARRLDKSEEQLRMILDLDPTDAVAHNDLGYQLADQNRKLDEAERLVRRALELDRLKKVDDLEDAGESAAYLDSLGWVLFRRGRLAEARAQLERASAQPDGAGDPTIWDHLGDVCARLDKPQDAAAAWGRAQELYRTEKHSLHDPRGDEVTRKLQRLKQPG